MKETETSLKCDGGPLKYLYLSLVGPVLLTLRTAVIRSGADKDTQ